MAKGDTTNTGSGGVTSKMQTPAKPSQLPQQNQYLTGNPNTESDANTKWMNPSDASSSTGINGGGGAQQAQGVPLQNGTMLGQISAGQVGQYMSGAWDQNKFNDPNKHDPKYDIGRILSKYPPGQEGLQAARNELAAAGYQIVGKDKIQGPAGIIDVGFSFSDPNAQHSWQWNPVVDTYNPQQNGMMNQQSMLGQQPMDQSQFLAQMFQQMMAQRQQYANQQFNPTGGHITPFAGAGWDYDASGNRLPTSGSLPYFGTGQVPQGGVSDQMQPMPVGLPSLLGQPNYSPIRYDQNGIKIS